jgi:hypothetical protein
MVDPVSISLTGVGGIILGILSKMLKDFSFNSNCKYAGKTSTVSLENSQPVEEVKKEEEKNKK